MNEVEVTRGSSVKSIIGVILIVGAVAGYALFSRGFAAEVAQLKADVSSTETNILDLQGRLDAFKSAENEFELTTEVNRLQSIKAVPVKPEQDAVIRDLIDITQTHDVRLNSISFSDGNSSRDDIGTLRINAGFEGNFADLKEFLQGLERNARLFRVESINVQLRDVEITGLKRANFSLTIETFFQK